MPKTPPELWGVWDSSSGKARPVPMTPPELLDMITEDMRSCLVAALEAVNGDTSHNGFSPAQWVLGKQPRGVGAVIPNDASARLAEHSMVTDDPSFARTVAMREVAKLQW